MFSSARAAPARFPTASSIARSRTRISRPQGADRVRQGRRTARNPIRRQAAHRHVPPGAWWRTSRRPSSARRRDPLREQGDRPSHRCKAGWQPAGSRRGAGQRRAHCGRHVVLAVGHSARDTFEMLGARGVHIEAKPSIGFRIEHPQSLIDRCRTVNSPASPLGAADYKLVHHASNGSSVYSFCMCPGGTVVAAASEPGRLVTNGMSRYSRNGRNANAGIVVGVTPDDYPGASARRHRIPAALGGTGVRGRRLRPMRRRRNASATSSPGNRINRARRESCRHTGRRWTPADLRSCLPDFVDRRDPRSAPSVRTATQGVRACPTRR